MAKTILFQGSGTVTPGDGTNSFVQSDLSAPKTIRVEGMAQQSSLQIVNQNQAEDGWEIWGVQLNNNKKTATPMENGTFALQGVVEVADGYTNVTVYIEDAS